MSRENGIPIVEIRLSGLKQQVVHAMVSLYSDLERTIEEELEKSIKAFDIRSEIRQIAEHEIREQLRKTMKDSIQKTFNECRPEIESVVRLRVLKVLNQMEFEP